MKGNKWVKLLGGVLPVRFVNADSSHTVHSNELPSTEEESKNLQRNYACCFRQRGEDKSFSCTCWHFQLIAFNSNNFMLKWFLWGIDPHPLYGQYKKSWAYLPQATLGLLSFLFSLSPNPPSSDLIYFTSDGAQPPDLRFSKMEAPVNFLYLIFEALALQETECICRQERSKSNQ